MKYFPRAGLIALSLSLALPACNADKVAEKAKPAGDETVAALTTEKQRVSYMVGLDAAKSMTPIKDELDIDTVVQAIRTAHAGGKPLIDEAQTNAIRQDFSGRLREKRAAELAALAARNQQASDAFLAEHAKQPGIKTTATGLQYQVLREGKGDKPTASDTVRVNYVGTLLDGRKFESTYDTDHPAEFVLKQVMPGWTEGVSLMPVGGKYKFWIPAKLAYGERGIPGQIEPNATLAFEVELLEIAGKPAP